MPTRTQPRTPRARPTRTELLILIKHHLERAGPRGVSKAELLAAIGPNRTSLRSIQRAFADLRTNHDAALTCFGKRHRWRLDAPLPLPLDAPDTSDLVGFVYLLALAEPLLSRESYARLQAAVEELDARARLHTAPSELPRAGAITSSYTHASRVDPQLVGRLLLACRRATVRIRYESPWDDKPGPVSHDIEPWAIHVHDANHYVRAWSIARKEPRTFNCAFIQSLELVDPAPRRQPIPTRPWSVGRRRTGAAGPEGDAAFGVDSDRPGVAAIRFRGAIARWVASRSWHPEQRDKWIAPRELLERTMPYHSCRELTRHLSLYADGIVALEPAELRAEVVSRHARVARRLR